MFPKMCFLILILHLLTCLVRLSVSEEGNGSTARSCAWSRSLQLGYVRPDETDQVPPFVQEGYFLQILDHFDNNDKRVWEQHYYFTDIFWRSTDGPVFLFLGGEAPMNPSWMLSGQWFADAQKYGAMMFLIDHRFYGKTRTTEDTSLNNLRLLSSDQALEDFAHFISVKNWEFGLHNKKWIIFGGSYAGNLAAWMRLKFPNIVCGAVASSAPVAMKTNFWEFYNIVTRSLDYAYQGCSLEIFKAVQELDSLIALNRLRTITSMLRLCSDLAEPDDVSLLMDYIARTFGGIVQHNGMSSFGITAKDACRFMMDVRLGSPLRRYSTIHNLILERGGTECLTVRYDEYVNDLANITYNEMSAVRLWIYQCCTEFGYFQSSDGNFHVFGKEFGINFSLKQCRDIFGPRFDASDVMRSVELTTQKYGGRAIAYVSSNIIFVNGGLDPWSVLGILRTKSSHTTTIFLEGVSHISDMYNSTQWDVPQLNDARRVISNEIGHWINTC